MNNMQFDEATQTYRGTVEPYRWNGEEQGQTFAGFNKPVQVTTEWISHSYQDVFASYWQDRGHNEGNWETFAVKPWAYTQQTQNPVAQATDGALQQLIQAMAGFAPASAGTVSGLVAGAYSAVQMLGVDGGS